MGAFTPCIAVDDTAKSIAFYESLGFSVDTSSASEGDDLNMLAWDGKICAMLYRRAHLDAWLPGLQSAPLGFTGMFYLPVDDFDARYEQFKQQVEIIKEPVTDHNGFREFYFCDPDGYVIGINDATAMAGIAGADSA